MKWNCFKKILCAVWAAVFSITAFSQKTSFGPELEFRGVKQLPSVLCAATVYEDSAKDLSVMGQAVIKKSMIGVGLSAIPVAADAVLDDEDKSNVGELTSATMAAASIAGIGFGKALIYMQLNCKKIRAKYDRIYDEKLEASVKEMCEKSGCTIKIVKREVYWQEKPYRDFHVTYPDGFKVMFTHDPSVIEVKTSPVSAEGIEKRIALIQADVFETMKKVGLRAPRLDGPWNAGQIHIGTEDFKNIAQLRNFLADIYNHPELSEGILGLDPIEAQMRGKDGGKRLKEAIEHLDTVIKSTPTASIESVAADLENILPKDGYGVTFRENFKTVELRFIRAQLNAQQLSDIANLYQARLLYIVSLGDAPIALKKIPRKLSAAQKLSMYQEFVEQSGQNWEHYRKLAPSYLYMMTTNISLQCMLYFQKLIQKPEKGNAL